MKKILSEAYEWKLEKKMNKSGEPYYIAAIDPQTSTDDTYAVREKIKEFGGKWDNTGRRWVFLLSNDPTTRQTQIERYVKPCMEYLKSVEKQPNGNDVEAEVRKLIAQIDQVVAAINANPQQGGTPEEVGDAKAVKNRLEQFKQELLASFQDNTFREKMDPIIKYMQAQGAGYSIFNSMLILMQNPQAKMVKSEGKWKKANKVVKPGAKKIWLWVPLGKRAHTPEESKEIEDKYLRKMSRKYGRTITSRNELNVGDREILEKRLNAVVATGFELMPRFYDVADVEQMEGKEDMIGSLDGYNDIKWYDDDTPEDNDSIQLYNSIVATIEEFGIRLTYAPDLGGARGVSRGGEIAVLQDAPKNIGTVSTLVHELSHELLHQTYLRDSQKEGRENFAQYFVGNEYGRQMVEQQAEVSAWIVMRTFNYDMETAKRYIACWGGDDKTTAYAFDSAAKVADRIIKGMVENMTIINENFSKGGTITGLDIAKLMGMEDTYMRGKQAERQGASERFGAMMERLNNVKF